MIYKTDLHIQGQEENYNNVCQYGYSEPREMTTVNEVDGTTLGTTIDDNRVEDTTYEDVDVKEQPWTQPLKT